MLIKVCMLSEKSINAMAAGYANASCNQTDILIQDTVFMLK